MSIRGIAYKEHAPGIVVSHAGTKFDDKIKTSGGRVLGVTAIGDAFHDAPDRAYEAATLIGFECKQYRSDIGAKSLWHWRFNFSEFRNWNAFLNNLALTSKFRYFKKF